MTAGPPKKRRKKGESRIGRKQYGSPAKEHCPGAVTEYSWGMLHSRGGTVAGLAEAEGSGGEEQYNDLQERVGEAVDFSGAVIDAGLPKDPHSSSHATDGKGGLNLEQRKIKSIRRQGDYQQKKPRTGQDKIQELKSMLHDQDAQHKVLERKQEKMLENSKKASSRARDCIYLYNLYCHDQLLIWYFYS